MSGTEAPVLVMKEALPIEQVQLGFPVYAVNYSADDGTLFVAGGGGPAKTGVRNAIVRSWRRGRARRLVTAMEGLRSRSSIFQRQGW